MYLLEVWSVVAAMGERREQNLRRGERKEKGKSEKEA
jgi:hypothetical protein